MAAGYGLAEATVGVSAWTPGAPPKVDARGFVSVGKPFPGVDMAILAGGEIAGAGVEGEILVRGPATSRGYFRNPEATAKLHWRDGYLRTGDLGYLEEDSRLVFLSRIGDVLRLSGYLVSPREIESVIEAHPTVAACQVIGTPTAGGLRPVAFVTLQPTAAFVEDDLAQYCQAALAKYKWPVRFVALDAFPTTASPNGVKVQRHRLRELAAALLAGS
jgi:fatty-acyl-CoA synthase